MKLSIVTTLYGSELYIERFYDKCMKACGNQGFSLIEFIFVDDGSFDSSNDIVRKLIEEFDNINLVELSRNFGHHEALLEGLEYADGDIVFLLDCDLEEDPDWFSTMFEKLQSQNLDVVYGVQKSRRKESPLYRAASKIFYHLFRTMTKIYQPSDILTCRVMKKNYVHGLLQYKEREINIGGLFLHAGYKQSYLKFDKKSNSPTTYTLQKKISHLLNAITSFSNIPLYLSFYFGLVITFFSFIYIIYLVIMSQLVSTENTGYWSTIVSICFFSGVLLLMQGIQGIYLSKIFLEVKRRPRVIVSDKVGSKFK